MSQKPSLRKIAASLGLAPSTVVHVSKGRYSRVSPETYQRVEAELIRLGYEAVRQQSSQIVGVMMTPPARPFAGDDYGVGILSGLIDAATAFGVPAMVQETAYFSNRLDLWPGMMEQVAFLAIVAIDPQSPALQALRQNQTPRILVGGGPNIGDATASLDDLHAGRLATRFLLEQGHRRLAFVGYGQPLSCTPIRLQGMKDELSDWGLPHEPVFSFNSSLEWPPKCDDAVRQILVMPREKRPTAILCRCSAIGLSMSQSLHREGLHLPADMSIICIDDDNRCLATRPALTCIRQPLHEIGYQAVSQMMTALQEGRDYREINIRLKGSLVIRESVVRAK